MKRILKQLLRLWHLAMVALIFVLTFPFVYFFSRQKSTYRQLNFFRKICAFFPSALSGIFYRITYKQKIDWSRNYIFCPNHASNLDIFAMSLVVKNNFFFLGKEELLKNPVTRIYFKTIDIPINRAHKISAFRAFKKTAERLQEGMTAVIFPEGRIADDYPPVLQDFKTGPFRLAIEYQIPIVPVTLKDNWKIFWDDGQKYGCKPGVSHICVHPPIEVAGFSLKDEDLLRQLVFDQIKSAL
ncbi:lysophospholipid acyltransferase family protein [Pelobium manganitolerans]|uniref:lysophospholipid acyltransferase family protein n=1 Tax=Pelobium manganitolerans TaxID=1842495 RepID=UPI003FA35301